MERQYACGGTALIVLPDSESIEFCYNNFNTPVSTTDANGIVPQHFDNVPVEAWEQPIGGYRPAEKWLKDRKGRVLAQDDPKHYQRIILALAKTREIMNGLMK